MKKIERRTLICRILALLLAAGMGLFVVKYVLHGGSWASSAFNRHLYNTDGQLASGTVLTGTGTCCPLWRMESGPIMTTRP